MESIKLWKDTYYGRCQDCNYCKHISAGDWSFYGCQHEPYKGKWVVEIKDCPKIKED